MADLPPTPESGDRDWLLYPALSLAVAGLGGAYVYLHHSAPIVVAPAKPYKPPPWVDTAYFVVFAAYLFFILFRALFVVVKRRKMEKRHDKEYDEAYAKFDEAGRVWLEHPNDWLARHNYEVLHQAVLDVNARHKEEWAGL